MYNTYQLLYIYSEYLPMMGKYAQNMWRLIDEIN
jgi:hypothetical protein